MKFLFLLLILLLLNNNCYCEESIKITDTFIPKVCKIKSKVGQTITVHYTGKLTNGYVFDSSIGGDPFTFKLGQHKVIPGFESGLLNLCIHQKRTIRIPASLGYGSKDLGDIPPNSVLIFDVELIKIA